MLKIFLLLISALTIVACGGDDTDEIVGTWEVISEVESASATFLNDGRCLLRDNTGIYHGTYRVFGNLLEMNFDGQIISTTFSIDGNLMTWEGGLPEHLEDFVVFERV